MYCFWTGHTLLAVCL